MLLTTVEWHSVEQTPPSKPISPLLFNQACVKLDSRVSTLNIKPAITDPSLHQDPLQNFIRSVSTKKTGTGENTTFSAEVNMVGDIRAAITRLYRHQLLT